MENQIVIYKDESNAIQLEVKMDGDMLWLTRGQLATLFGRDYKTISKHINNALKEELADEVVVAKFANTTQHGAIEGKTQTHEVEYFNLEMVTSIGYRVKSARGVQFRKWANRILKEYLIKGYAVNDHIRKEQIGELRQLVGMIGRTLQNQPLISTDETNALFEVVTDYTYALDTLDNYDYERLTIDKTTKQEHFHATYENAMEAIDGLRRKFGGSSLLGNEKDDSFKSSIGQIYQTFGGEELYPSVNSPFLAKKWKISYVFIKNFRKKKIISQIICIFAPIIYGNMEVKKLNRLKVVMAEKDLSNTWLSDRLGVSQATVSKWMTNFSQPNLETLIKISKVLNVDLNELVRPDEVQIDEEA